MSRLRRKIAQLGLECSHRKGGNVRLGRKLCVTGKNLAQSAAKYYTFVHYFCRFSAACDLPVFSRWAVTQIDRDGINGKVNTAKSRGIRSLA